VEGYLGQQPGQDDPVLVTERVLDEARRAFSNLDAAVLELVVSEAVAELWGDSIQVTTFVPVLAMRQIRDVLEAKEVVPLEATVRSA
jgi:hypothetical protein